MICTIHNNQPRGIVIKASMNDLIMSVMPASVFGVEGQDVPIEPNDTDESTTHSTNQDGLPPRIVNGGSHQNIKVFRGIIHRDLVVYDLNISLYQDDRIKSRTFQ